MGKFRPRVSIGMPVFNGDAHLEAALDSVLAQSFTDFELIISDNASTDRTEEICRAYAARDGRIRYFSNDENLGAARNFNRVFRLSSGEYFKWFAHDDILAPRYLQRCVETLDRAPSSVVLCFPRRRFITPNGRVLDYEPHLMQSKRTAAKSLHRINFARLVRVCNSRFPVFVFGLMRAAAVGETRLIGSYPAADLVFVAEMKLLGDFWEVPEGLFFQRLHSAAPDVLERMTRTGNVAWFDPANRSRFLMPEGRLLLEYVHAIHRAGLGTWEKGRCYCALTGYVLTRPRRWMIHLARKTRGSIWECWSRISLGAVKVSKFTSIPLRLWAFSSGLRGRVPERIRLALSKPWSGTHAALLGFAAERLCRRKDSRADRMLADWLTDSCAARRVAAAQAMGPRPGRFGAVVRDCLQAGPEMVGAESSLGLLAAACGPENARAWSEVLAGGGQCRA